MTGRPDLGRRRALVTGASSGLGRHFARVLAGAGAHVVVVARRRAKLESLVSEITAEGGSASPLVLDVADIASIEPTLEAAGPIDILVNNAGVADARSVLDYDEASFDHIVETNLKGAFFVAVAAARSMKSRAAPGTIINVASILGLRQGALTTPYSISKAGVVQMTKQLALELARDNIRVNAIAPGYFQTDINRAFFATSHGRAMIKRIPQRRLGELSDLDGPLLFLASDASAFVTGIILPVDGGHLLSSL